MLKFLFAALLFLMGCSAHAQRAALPPLPKPPSPATAPRYVELEQTPRFNPHDCSPDGMIPFRTNEFFRWLPETCRHVAPSNLVAVVNRTNKGLVPKWVGYSGRTLVPSLEPGPDGVDYRVTTAVLTVKGPRGVIPPCSVVYTYQPAPTATLEVDVYAVPVGAEADRVLIDDQPHKVLSMKAPGPDGPVSVVAAKLGSTSQPNILGQVGGKLVEFAAPGACSTLQVVLP